jgi:hypothetical protein
MGSRQLTDLRGLTGAPPIRPHQWDANVVSPRIDVDARRMLFALSIPEYIEAWLQAPDADEMLMFDFVTDQRFNIGFYRTEALRASIHGSSRVVNRTRVHYMWKTISASGITHTTVDLMILAREDGCVVVLNHRGFCSLEERAWHCNMWERSLEKLRRIVRIHRLSAV